MATPLLAVFWIVVFVMYCSGHELPKVIHGCAILMVAMGFAYEYLKRSD